MSLLNVLFFIGFVSGDWQVNKDWSFDKSSGYNTAAFSENVSNINCSEGKYLVFPNIMHSPQEVYLDGELIYRFGSKESRTVRSIYGAPIIDCESLLKGKKIDWEIFSPIKFFSKIHTFPSVTARTSIINGSDVKHLTIYGSLIVFALMLAFGPKTKDLRRQSIYLCVFSIAMGIFFFSSVLGYFGISMHYLIVDKIAAASLGVATASFIQFMLLRNLLKKKLANAFSFLSVVGTMCVPFCQSGDDVQNILNVIFAPALVSVWISLAAGFSSKSLAKNTKKTELFGLASFAVSATADIFYTFGIHQYGMTLGYGVLGTIFFFSRTLQKDVTKAYEERDYLRENLEKEVKAKTNHLDITLAELKATQAELVQNAKLASLGTFSAGIAHEINNSINYVNAGLTGLERQIFKDINDEVKKQKLEKLFSTVKHGTKVTIDIVGALRNYTGLNHAVQKEIRLREIIDSVTAIIRGKIGSIQIECQFDDNLTLYCHVVGMNQIFMNLITNAIDAVDSSKGKIVIRANQDKDKVVIEVSDNGQGIPAAIVDKIYDPFFTTKDVGKGTGLGLHIIKKEIEENHKGSISVSSELGSGTTFKIILPILDKYQKEAA